MCRDRETDKQRQRDNQRGRNSQAGRQTHTQKDRHRALRRVTRHLTCIHFFCPHYSIPQRLRIQLSLRMTRLHSGVERQCLVQAYFSQVQSSVVYIIMSCCETQFCVVLGGVMPCVAARCSSALCSEMQSRVVQSYTAYIPVQSSVRVVQFSVVQFSVVWSSVV